MFINGDPGLSPLFFFKRDNGLNGLDDVKLFSHARSALLFYLDKLKKIHRRNQLLLPDYICNDIVISVKRYGYDVVFYSIDDNLRPNLDSIKDGISNNTIGVVIIHYFGFYTSVDEILDYCKKKDIVVIEDCAHVLFKDINILKNNFKSDAIIYSLRKVFPIPDGALLYTKNSEGNENIYSYHYKINFIEIIKLFVKYVLSHTTWLKSIKRVYGNENYLDIDVYEVKNISNFSKIILQKYVNVDFIGDRRRDNFYYYIKIFDEKFIYIDNVKIVHRSLKDFEIPYMFPMKIVNGSRRLIQFLRGNGIPAISWPTLPKEIIKSPKHGVANKMREDVVLLPLHQDISFAMIDYIFYKISEFYCKKL